MQVLDRLDARGEETPAPGLGSLARTGGVVLLVDVLARAEIGVQYKPHLYETAMLEEPLPTRQFEIKGIRHRAGRGGLGAPVVLYLDRSRQQGRPATETNGALADPSVAHFPNLLY